MGIDKNVYIVKIAKSIAGPRVLAHRTLKGRYIQFSGYFPYSLAMYLNLMPEKDSSKFTHKLYDFTNQDLDSITPGDCILKVSSRGTHKIITIDMSKI